jgi:EAL and modified HD-GYP domain-containing signal transduction protein
MNLTQASTVYIARPAIFDVDKKVVAYELLYWNSGENFATIADANLATAKVVTNALLEMGLAQLIAGRPAFINVPGEFLVAH